MSHSYVAEYKSTLKSSSAMFTVQQLEQETGVSFQDWKVDTVNDLVKRLQADNYYLNRGKLTEIKEKCHHAAAACDPPLLLCCLQR